MEFIKDLVPYFLPLLGGGLLSLWWNYRIAQKKARTTRHLIALEIKSNSMAGQTLKEEGLPWTSPFSSAIFDRYSNVLFIFKGQLPSHIVDYYSNVFMARKIAWETQKSVGERESVLRKMEETVIESGKKLSNEIKEEYPEIFDWDDPHSTREEPRNIFKKEPPSLE